MIVQPLKESNISTLIAIDALDECKGEEPASAIFSVLGQSVSEIPNVKFFIANRPEPRIREGFRLPLLVEATDVIVLGDVNPSQLDDDTQLFFTHEFSGLSYHRRGSDDWPTKEQLDLLFKWAAGRFVYAVATANFIGKQSANPVERLNLLLRSPKGSGREDRSKLNESTTLDSLYTSVLMGAFGDEEGPVNDRKVRSVLGAMALAANRISYFSIAKLLDLDPDRDVFPLPSSAQSLLIFQENVNRPVHPFYKSIPDFVVDPDRCTNQRVRLSPPHHHSQLLISWCICNIGRHACNNFHLAKVPGKQTFVLVGGTQRPPHRQDCR